MARSEGNADSDTGEQYDPTAPLLQRSPSFTLGHRKSGDGQHSTISGDGFEDSIQVRIKHVGDAALLVQVLQCCQRHLSLPTLLTMKQHFLAQHCAL
jgi:hypothetical protein